LTRKGARWRIRTDGRYVVVDVDARIVLIIIPASRSTATSVTASIDIQVDIGMAALPGIRVICHVDVGRMEKTTVVLGLNPIWAELELTLEAR